MPLEAYKHGRIGQSVSSVIEAFHFRLRRNTTYYVIYRLPIPLPQ